MAFRYHSNLLGEPGRILRKYVLDASKTFSVGDAMTVGTAGDQPGPSEIVNATVGVPVLGIIVAITDKNGLPPSSDGASGTFKETYTTPASNETGTQICALVDCSPFSIWSVAADDTLGTTTGSNKSGYMFMVPASLDTSNHLIDESTSLAAATVTSAGQFLSHGLDPQDTTKVLVNICKSILFAGDTGG